MTTILDTALTIESWDEQPTRELADGRKFSRAQVRLGPAGDGAGGPDALRSGTYEALLYYAADGGSTYVTVMEVYAVLQGRIRLGLDVDQEGPLTQKILQSVATALGLPVPQYGAR